MITISTNQKSQNSSNPFENEEVAATYDMFYDNPVGKMYDLLEKNAVRKLLMRSPSLIPNDPTKTMNNLEILEIGSGTGHWTRFLSEIGYSVFGIEKSRAMLDVALKKNLKNVVLVEGDVCNLESNSQLQGKSFDIGVFMTSLEFLPCPIQSINAVCKFIKPKGSLIFGVLNDASILGQNRKKEPGVYRDAKFYTETELNSILSKYGTVTTLQSAFFTPDQLERAEAIEEESLNAGLKTGNFIACRVDLK